MSRPLTGSVRQRHGQWWVNIPEAKGSTRRLEEPFRSESDAEAWRVQAAAALNAGRAVPDPERFRLTPPPSRPKPAGRGDPNEPAKIQPDVASVANAWMAAVYEDLRRGGPERADRVRRILDAYLVPWFAPRTTTIADVTYFMAHGWLLHLVGRDQTPTPGAPGSATHRDPAPDRTHPDAPSADATSGEMTLAEAARACRVSVPTMRRRWHNGQLPGAYRDHHGRIRIPVRAIKTVKASKPAGNAGLSQRYVSEALWVLRRVLAFARANTLFPGGFDPTEGLEAPTPDPAVARTRRAKSRPRPFSLGESARIASHLHVVHQMVFWLQRIMGLRISEAYGILLSDAITMGDYGILAIQGQGGRNFSIRDDHGAIVTVAHKEGTKTSAGDRVLVAPSQIMELVRVAKDAFHTDPDTGAIDESARLVPGILRSNQGGQLGYHDALEDATTAEHLASKDLGFRVSSHLLRKSAASDLAWQEGIEDAVRRRFMGHRAGEDVFGRIYTLDDPELVPLVKVAAVLHDKIAATIGTLLTPTIRRPQWGKGNPIYPRIDHVDSTLAAARWLVDPGRPEDPLCDGNRVAGELGVAVTTARRWLRDGTLPAVTRPDAEGVPRRWVRQSDLLAHRAQLANKIGLPDLADELGVRYHELYGTVRRLDLTLERQPTSREYEVTTDAADAIRAEFRRIAALHQRSMKQAAAARQLKAALSTINLLVKDGTLEVDGETDSSNATFVTRASVQQCWIARNTTKRPRRQAVVAVPVDEVARFTGHTRAALMDLVRAGILQQLPGRQACQLTASSLRAWMDSRNPDEPRTAPGSDQADTAGERPAADGTIVVLQPLPASNGGRRPR